MRELWAEIPAFESYDISNYGAVRNRRGGFLTGQRNAQGIMYVSLWKGGRSHNRSIAPLVAGAFVDRSSLSWDTPIHLNGNKADVWSENLMWRPRWFAVDYHQQILQYADPVNRIREVRTGEEGTLRAICMRYGILPLKTYLQAVNYTDHGNRTVTVWPTGQMFELA